MAAAAVCVSAVDVADSVPDEEYVDVEEMNKYGYGLLWSIKNAVEAGHSWRTLTSVTIGDLVNTFARTGY